FYDIDQMPGTVDGLQVSEQQLGILWHDGVEWRPVGGSLDPENNLVSAQIGHFSRFAVGILPAATEDLYRPQERIITPALKDGINDFVQFGQLGSRPDISIKIFDVTGRKIRTVHTPYVWDGKDDDGDIVESGVYVYQFDVDGMSITGMIAVAK
ncbi:MAG: hypothetical protein GF384_01520, partial [Elusimicrobia bacterium]|nr:hypothetical protein [Elusimicrobiota bacterium]